MVLCAAPSGENTPVRGWSSQTLVQAVEEGAPFPPNPGLTDTLIRLLGFHGAHFGQCFESQPTVVRARTGLKFRSTEGTQGWIPRGPRPSDESLPPQLRG